MLKRAQFQKWISHIKLVDERAEKHETAKKRRKKQFNENL